LKEVDKLTLWEGQSLLSSFGVVLFSFPLYILKCMSVHVYISTLLYEY